MTVLLDYEDGIK